MPLKSIFFLMLFFILSFGSLFNPILGIIGYMAHYHIHPERQWWGVAMNNLGIRYSFTIALLLVIGTLINKNKLKFKKLFHGQEILLLIFLIIIWLSTFLGLESEPNYDPYNYPPLKVTKIVIFTLFLTHVVTDLTKYKMIIWTFVFLGLYLGYSCYIAPFSAYISGRLSIGIGGPDFAESSFLAGHFVSILPFMAIFVLTGNWKHKIIAIIAAAFVANAIILTQTRAAFVAAFVGVIFTIIWSIPQYRTKIIILLIIGALGALSLTNQAFWQRMETIKTDEEGKHEESAESRKVLWQTALRMMKTRPQGFGAGNFQKYMGDYNNNDYQNKDTHNTFLRCGAELGLHGLIVFLIMIVNAFLILKRIKRKAINVKDAKIFINYAYALQLTIIIYLICGFFMSQTYHEETFWFLLLPVCLERALENASPIAMVNKENIFLSSGIYNMSRDVIYSKSNV